MGTREHFFGDHPVLIDRMQTVSASGGRFHWDGGFPHPFPQAAGKFRKRRSCFTFSYPRELCNLSVGRSLKKVLSPPTSANSVLLKHGLNVVKRGAVFEIPGSRMIAGQEGSPRGSVKEQRSWNNSLQDRKRFYSFSMPAPGNRSQTGNFGEKQSSLPGGGRAGQNPFSILELFLREGMKIEQPVARYFVRHLRIPFKWRPT